MSQAPKTCTCPVPQKVEAPAGGPDTCAIILAGGFGTRYSKLVGKQYVDLLGLPVAAWSLLAFDRAPSVAQIVVVVAEDYGDTMRDEVLSRISLTKPVTFATGGELRQDSVFSGLKAMDQGLELVAVHDAARPLIQTDTIEGCIARVRQDQGIVGAICATPSTDTLKLVEDKTIIATPDRSFYWCAQTPQVFRAKPFMAAHRAARFEDYQGTDDASLVERRGGKVVCFPSPRSNIKLTVPEDYIIVRAYLEARLMQEGCGIDPMEGEAPGAGDLRGQGDAWSPSDQGEGH